MKKTIDFLEQSLLEHFGDKNNCWVGRQWMSAAVTAEFLILCKYINYQDVALINGALEELKSRQNEDGGFPAYYKGPSEISLSCICHLALELFQDQISNDQLNRCSRFIADNGGLKKSMLLPKFYHFLFGKYPARKLPEIRPGLNIVPKWIGFSIYDMASWVRSWIVPISILWHQEKYKNYHFGIKPYIPFIRRYSLKKAESWIFDHQESDGSWYGVFHSTMMSIMALFSLGYSRDHPVMHKAFNFVLSLHDRSDGRVRQQSFLGPVWDTALSLLALGPEQGYLDRESIQKINSFLLKRQSIIEGDWYKQNKTTPGGWSFEFTNDHYPDVDTTSVVLQALKILPSTTKTETALDNGLNWLLSMQNSDGSWSAFDKNNNHRIIEWYLNFRKYNIGKGPGLVLDRGTPDLTAHAMESLATFGYSCESKEVIKAIHWLKKKQQKDGSWFGRWGLCYIYGTGAVLEALKAIGEDMEADYVQKAVQFLEDHQNKDGGFGERPEAYYDSSLKGIGPSTLTQTAWTLLGLIKAGEAKSESVQKGILYLKEKIEHGEFKKELHFQAVAAPPMYQRYELYPYYFPLMALKAYSRLNILRKDG